MPRSQARSLKSFVPLDSWRRRDIGPQWLGACGLAIQSRGRFGSPPIRVARCRVAWVVEGWGDASFHEEY